LERPKIYQLSLIEIMALTHERTTPQEQIYGQHQQSVVLHGHDRGFPSRRHRRVRLAVNTWGGFLMALAVIPSLVHAAEGVPEFKAMVLYPSGKGSHHQTDFDYALEQEGVPFKHYTADNAEAILADLDQYSLLMCAPLVNLNKTFAGGEDAVRAWIKKGNALVITDACDGSMFNPWLSTLVPGAPLTTHGCKGTETIKHLFVRDAEPAHPLRCFPEKFDHESRQWQCLKSSPGWETVATCSGPEAIHPLTVLHPTEKGLVYVSSMQQRWSALPANLRSSLLLRRAGLAPISYKMTPPAFGPGTMELSLKSIGEKPGPVQFRLNVSASSEANTIPYTSLTPVVNPDREGNLSAKLDFTLNKEGPAYLSLEARTPASDWLPLLGRSLVIPPALEVLPPRYRSVLSTERRIQEVAFEVRKPGGGESLGINAAKVTVYDSRSKQLGTATVQSKTNGDSLTVKVPLPKLPAGEGYVVKAIARNSTGKNDEASTTFAVRAPGTHPGDTIIDEDGTLLVDGKPFFPLGIYHLEPAAFPQAAGLGFNTVQTFQWMTRNHESLNAAQKLGLKVLFEKNDKKLDPHRSWPAHIKNHPAFLMWYAPDEPLHEVNTKFAMDVADIYRKGDPFHPIICVDFNPPRFALNGQCSDIFGAETYNIKGKLDTPYWQAPDMVSVTRDAVKGRQPVFTVLRAAEGQSADAERLMAWLALTRDVRGLLWYAWDEGNGVGLKYYPELQEGLQTVLSEIRELTPALVAPVRRPFEVDDLYGIACDDGAARTVILVNASKEKSATIPEIPEFKGLSPEPLFGASPIDQPMAPLEHRAYRAAVRK